MDFQVTSRFPKKRFFFHYNKPESVRQGINVLTLHVNKTCYLVNSIKCNVPIESKNRQTQPRCVLQGFLSTLCLTKKLDGSVEGVIY